MKKILLLSLLAGLFSVALLSFTLTKEKHAPKKHATVKKPSNCVATITGFTVTAVSQTSVTMQWTYSGSPASFNYGGYYNRTGFPGVVTIPNTNTTSTTLTMPINSPNYGIRIQVVCVCSDGTTVGSGHGVYVENGHVVNYF